MSREIKFRGKCKDDDTWVFGSYVRTALGLNYILPQNVLGNSSIQWLVNGKTVGQYTGLKDKNGKEIYEGDILRYLDSYDCSTESGYDFEEFLNVGQVIFNDEKGRVDITNKSDISYDDWIESVSDCEIIGNIYENPELLAI